MSESVIITVAGSDVFLPPFGRDEVLVRVSPGETRERAGFKVANLGGVVEVRRAREWTFCGRIERIADALKAQASGAEGLHGDNDHHAMREAAQELRELAEWAQGNRAEVPAVGL